MAGSTASSVVIDEFFIVMCRLHADLVGGRFGWQISDISVDMLSHISGMDKLIVCCTGISEYFAFKRMHVYCRLFTSLFIYSLRKDSSAASV